MMELRTLSPALAPAWDDYVNAHPHGVWHHRSGWLDYCAARVEDCHDLSFALLDEEERIIGLAVVAVDPGNHWTMGGGPLPAPLASHALAEELVRAELARLANEHKPLVWQVEGSTDGLPNYYTWRPCGWQMRTLTGPPKPFELRHSYRSIIHRATEDYAIVVSRNPKDVEELHAMHRAEAGRETRSARTWALMAEWVQAGLAFLVMAENRDMLGERIAGAIYVYTYKGIAYYGHAATRRRNVNHVLLSESIHEHFATGGTRYDVGWIGHAANSKEANIEFFRQGFGGLDLPWPVTSAVVDSPDNGGTV